MSRPVSPSKCKLYSSDGSIACECPSANKMTVVYKMRGEFQHDFAKKRAMFTLELYFLLSGFGKKICSKILLLLPSCYCFCLLWYVAVPHRGQATVLQCFVEMRVSQKFVFQRSHTQSIVRVYTPKN